MSEPTFPSNLACDHARIGDYVSMCHACANKIERQAEEDRAAIWALSDALALFLHPNEQDSCAICRVKVEHAAAIARAKRREGEK